jgi:hypothetical protein
MSEWGEYDLLTICANRGMMTPTNVGPFIAP